MDQRPRARLVTGLLAVLALTALTAVSLLVIAPPAPAPADAPAQDFSAGRAFGQVQTIGEHVHVAGSPAADNVRGHITSTLTGLGLKPIVQDAVGQTNALGGALAMARVRNVIAVLPGTDPTGRLFLVAHYDSVQVSYGANDDGSGVATLLETARALAAGSQSRNDLVFVFTDAEEACLCGAEAFVSQDPLAADGGVVLNFESRGASGPAIMFETATGNSALIAQYAAAVPYPVATSMAVEVYRILPNDTDFTEFRMTGRFTGLNSAYIDGSAVYHSPQDRPGYMDTASLQHQGANALALARQLGNANLSDLRTPSANDATYFPVLGSLVRYPGWLVWPLAILGLLVVGALAMLVRRRQQAGWGRMSAGFGLALIPLLLAPVAAQLLWMLLVALRPGYRDMIDPWRPGWYRAAVVALVALIILGWFALLRRRFGVWSLTVGALGWLAVLGLVLAAFTPGGSYLAALPAIAGSAAAMVALALRQVWTRAAVLTLGGAVAVLVLAPTVLLFFPALGLATGAAAAMVAALLGSALVPVFDMVHPVVPKPIAARSGGPVLGSTELGVDSPTERRFAHRLASAAPALLAAVLVVTFTGIGLAVDSFDAMHPAPTQLMYALDADTSTAHWVSSETEPSAWTSRYVTDKADLSGQFPLLRGSEFAGPAQAADLPAPTLSVDADHTSAGRRTLTVTVHPHREVRLVDLTAPGVTVLQATVQGREMPAQKSGFQLLFHAPPPEGVTVTLILDRTEPVNFRVMDGSDGLSALPGFSPRPPGVGVQGSHTSELVLVAATVTI